VHLGCADSRDRLRQHRGASPGQRLDDVSLTGDSLDRGAVAERTTAPIRCSARTARRRRTFVSGVTVTTCVPLTRSTSLIRIRPSHAPVGADRVPVGTPRLLLQAAAAVQGAAGSRRSAESRPRPRRTAVHAITAGTRTHLMACMSGQIRRPRCSSARQNKPSVCGALPSAQLPSGAQIAR
jgi:hypothetical protein